MDKTFITGFNSANQTIWVNLKYVQYAYLFEANTNKWHVMAMLNNEQKLSLAHFDSEEKAAEEMEKVFGKLAAYETPKPPVGISVVPHEDIEDIEDIFIFRNEN